MNPTKRVVPVLLSYNELDALDKYIYKVRMYSSNMQEILALDNLRHRFLLAEVEYREKYEQSSETQGKT